MAFPKYKPPTKPEVAPAAPAEPGILESIFDWFSSPAVDNLSGGEELRRNMATVKSGEVDENGEISLGTKARAFASGALEGITPANIAEAITLKGTGRVIKEGVKAAGGFGKFLTNRTTTKKLVETVPEYAKALKNTSKLGQTTPVLIANAGLGAAGAHTAFLDDDATPVERLLGAVQGVGGAAGFGVGVKGRQLSKANPKVPPPSKVGPADLTQETAQAIEKAHPIDVTELGLPKDKKVPEVRADIAKALRQEFGINQTNLEGVNEFHIPKAVEEFPLSREAKTKGLPVDKQLDEQARLKEAIKLDLPPDRQRAEVKAFAKDKADAAKAQEKFVSEEQKGLADLSKILDNFMDDVDVQVEERAARQAVEDALQGKVGQGKSVSIRSTDKSVPGETRTVSERFAEPPTEKPKADDGGIPFDPDLDGPDADIPVNKSIPIVDPASTGPSKPLPKNINKIQHDLKKARAIAQNYGMGVRQNPDGLYELVPKQSADVAAPTGVLTHDVFKTWAEAKGAQNKVGGKIVGSLKSGFKVVGPEDPAPAYNPKDQSTWSDISKNGPDDPAPPPAGSPVPAGPKPKGGSPKGGLAVAPTKSGKAPKASALESLAPEELEELDKIIAEMESQPHQARTWNWDVPEGDGNAAGGKAIIQAGNAGAPVYHELLKFLSGLPETQGGPSRQQILDALVNFRKGNNNVWGRRAVEVAKQRIAKRGEAARLDEWVRDEEARSAAANIEGPKDPTISSQPEGDEDLINGLLQAAQDGGYTGDLQTLKVKLLTQLEGLDPAFGKFLKDSGTNWWDELDNLSNQSDEVVDVLPTGEAQPRLDGEVGAVRDLENPNPEFEAPLSLTPTVAEAPEGVTGSLFAPDELPLNPKNEPVKVDSGAALIDMMNDVPPSPAQQGVIPVAALRRSKMDVLGDHARKLQEEATASGETLPKVVKNNPTASLSQAPKKQGARIAGLGLANLGKEARIAKDNISDVTDLESLSPELRKKAIAEMIRREKGEAGFAANELGIRAGLGIAGGLAGGPIAEKNDIDPTIGMLGGAAAGFMTPSAAKMMIEAANASGDVQKMTAAAEKAKNVFNQSLALLPDYVRASLLFNFPNIFINSWIGPYGSAVMGALEHLVADPTDPRALKAFSNLANPVKVVSAYGRNWKNAGSVIAQANNRGESSQALEKAPKLVRQVLSIPGQFMTAGDLAAKDMLTDAGFSTDAARTMTLTDEPEMGWARFVREGMRAAQTEGGIKSTAARMALPFHKTVLNQAESSLERTPLVGLLANARWKDNADPMNLQVAQQIVGTGVLGGMFMLGTITPADPATTPILLKVISNAGGQYGMLAAAAFTSGQAYANGAEIREVAEKFGASLVNNVPLPTMRPIKEMGGLAMDGLEVLSGSKGVDELTVPRSIIPQGLRYDEVVEARDNTKQFIKPLTDKVGITEPSPTTPSGETGQVGPFGIRY